MSWHCRDLGHSPKSVNTILRGARRYYKYRIESGELLENPVFGLTVTDGTRRLPHGLLEYEALEKMYRGYTITGPKASATKQNGPGAAVCQALTVEELEKLQPGYIKLKEGRIGVPGGPRSNRRMLPLEASQILELQEYQEKIREGAG